MALSYSKIISNFSSKLIFENETLSNLNWVEMYILSFLLRFEHSIYYQVLN
jgi:hypothetical protein